jgi:hypothetical protein
VEICSRSKSAKAEKFRDFITELLFQLFTGKIQILVLDNEKLQSENAEYLQRLAITEEKQENLLSDLQTTLNTLSEICAKERVQKSNAKKHQKWFALVKVVQDEDIVYKAHRLQYYQMNQKLKQYEDWLEDDLIDDYTVLLHFRTCSSLDFWQSCWETQKMQ